MAVDRQPAAPAPRSRDAGSLPLWPLGFLLLFPLAVSATYVSSRSALSGDPGQFSARMDDLFAGAIPYIGFEYEHLPLAIVPMALAKAVSSLFSGGHYHIIYAAIATVGVLLTGLGVDRLGRRFGDTQAVNRALVLSAVTAPVVVFRLDAFSAALAAFGLLYIIDRRDRAASLATGAGIAFKGWPVVLAPVLWWRGNRRTAVWLAGFAVALVGALSLTEGFRSGRSFEGVHQETISGSLVMAWRALRGAASGIFPTAGALYIEVGQWALGVNLVIGGALGIAALAGLRRRYSDRGAVDMAGALTGALALASPLLSAQFVYWLVPFVAVQRDRVNQVCLALAGAMTTVMLAVWWPGRLWWALLLVARNLLLVVVTVRFVMAVNRPAGDSSSVMPPVGAAT